MKPVFMSVSVLLLSCVAWLAVAFSAQQPAVPKPQGSASPAASPPQEMVLKEGDNVTTIFDGNFSLRATDKRSGQPKVVVRLWTIHERQRIAQFPEKGFLIMQCVAGELTTVINGQRQQRSTDEFWVVPKGATVSLETDKDTAILKTWSVVDR